MAWRAPALHPRRGRWPPRPPTSRPLMLYRAARPRARRAPGARGMPQDARSARAVTRLLARGARRVGRAGAAGRAGARRPGAAGRKVVTNGPVHSLIVSPGEYDYKVGAGARPGAGGRAGARVGAGGRAGGAGGLPPGGSGVYDSLPPQDWPRAELASFPLQRTSGASMLGCSAARGRAWGWRMGLLCWLLGHKRWWVDMHGVEREVLTPLAGGRMAWRCWRCGAKVEKWGSDAAR